MKWPGTIVFVKLSLVFIIGLCSIKESQAQVLPGDSLALVTLYNSTGGPNWTRKNNWLINPVSTWYGITVVGNRVTQINMNPISPPFSGNNLVGTLPSVLGSLTGLTRLDLAYNKLSGSLPLGIGNLTNLTFLNLSNNQFSGSIPSTIGNFTKLTSFLLNNNQFTGSIPTQLGSLTNLVQINLTFNNLTGTIPTTLGSLSNLTQLLLQQNQLSGSIPSQLGSLSNLVSLSLSENQLTGTIPTQLGNLSKLSELNLTLNQLSGSIPSQLGNLGNLQFLRLNRNQFSGTLPNELGNLSKLQELLLGNNQLNGAVPAGLAAIGTLTNAQFQNNSFTDMPAFGGSVFTLNVSTNNLTFEDLEPNRFISNFTYIPQKIIPGGGIQNKIVGEQFSIGFVVGGTANQYQWRKDGVNKSGATSTNLTIPAVDFPDAGVYALLITNSLVPGLILQTEPTTLTVTGIPIIDITSDGTNKPNGSTLTFDATDVFTDRFKELTIANNGSADLLISNVQVTGDFSLEGVAPPSIAMGSSAVFNLRFRPTEKGARVGTFTMTSNATIADYVINLEGDGEAELEIYNVVSTNLNGKHDFFNIRNIWLYPDNRVKIYDRWGNEVYDQSGYDSDTYKFTGESNKGKELPEGTYFYVIYKDQFSEALTGFLFLRRN